MDKILSFDNVYQNGKAAGILKIHTRGLGWKGKEGAAIITVEMDDVTRFVTANATRGSQLQVYLRNGTVHRFDNLPKEMDEIKRFITQHYKLDLDVLDLSLRGWNWGDTEIKDSMLIFYVNKKPAFQIPMSEVSNASLSGKSEVSVEFAPSDSKDPNDQSLVDIRFHVPNVSQDDEDNKSDEDGDQPKATAAMLLHDAIKENIEGGQTAGEKICVFEEVQCIYPRGRYDLEFYDTFVRLHGKTYNYKLKYDGITQIFSLPKDDDRFTLLMIGLEAPFRQGQTSYQFLIFQIAKDEETTMNLNIKDDDLESRFKGKLKKEYAEAPTTTVLTDLLKAFTTRDIIVPGSYRSEKGLSCVRATHKASEGWIYPLEKSLLFLPKPPILMRHRDITNIEIARFQSSRTFDLIISLQKGAKYTLSQVSKGEKDALFAYFKEKRLPVDDQALVDDEPMAVDDHSADEEESEEGSEEEGSSKRRQASKRAEKRTAAELEDDEDEEDDEDFALESESSDDDEDESESGSGGDDDQGDEDEEERPKKKKTSKEPAKKKAKTEKKSEKKKATASSSSKAKTKEVSGGRKVKGDSRAMPDTLSGSDLDD